VTIATAPSALGFIKDGRLRALAVGSPQRLPLLPDVPTLAEAGVRHADVELQFWFGLFAPKGVPDDVKAKLEKAVERIVASPAMRERLATLDVTVDFRPGPALQAQLQSEIKNWSSFIEAKGIKAQ
jgi:tripartite-type tricarboxylate transporter receptor subunit TctC